VSAGGHGAGSGAEAPARRLRRGVLKHAEATPFTARRRGSAAEPGFQARNAGAAGMTLLELVVALTITGAAMAAGYGAFATLVDQWPRITAATDEVARAAAVRRTLVEWLCAARVGLGADGPEFRGLDGIAGGDPDDELTFVTDAPTPLGDAATIVRLFVDRDPTTPERGLTAALAEWRGTARKRVELEPRVTGLDVRFLSSILGGDRWLPSWISRSVLPRGVEIRLTASPPDTLPALLTLPVTVAPGGGQ